MSRRQKPDPELEEFGDETEADTTPHPLTSHEIKKIHRVAVAAATVARYERARKLLPFDRLKWLHPIQLAKAQKLTVWLMTLEPLRKFHKEWLGKQRKNGNIRVCRPGELTAGTLFEPHTVKTFEEFAQELALRFSAHVLTDEVRELQKMAWTVTVATSGVFDPKTDSGRTYMHKPSRSIVRLLGGQELVDVTEYIQVSRDVDAETPTKEPLPDGQTISNMVKAAEQAGHKRELDQVYKTTYEESESQLTEELLDDPERTAKLDKRDRRRNNIKKASKGVLSAGKLLATLKGLKS